MNIESLRRALDKFSSDYRRDYGYKPEELSIYRAGYDLSHEQIEKLAKFIKEEFPGALGQGDDVIDIAMRAMKRMSLRC